MSRTIYHIRRLHVRLVLQPYRIDAFEVAKKGEEPAIVRVWIKKGRHYYTCDECKTPSGRTAGNCVHSQAVRRYVQPEIYNYSNKWKQRRKRGDVRIQDGEHLISMLKPGEAV